MTFRELTKDELKAMAGWASVRSKSVPDTEMVALRKFHDGCETLIEFAPSQASTEPPTPPQETVPKLSRNRTETIPKLSRTEPEIPTEVKAHFGLGAIHEHKFDLHSQFCWCGVSRKQHLESSRAVGELSVFQTP